MQTAPISVDEYILGCPLEVQVCLNQLRQIILGSDKEVQESISYGMPAYKTYGRPLVYFAAYKNHIGLYATPSAGKQFVRALKKYKQGKGSIQFPLNEPIPFSLITKIVLFRVEENKTKYSVLRKQK